MNPLDSIQFCYCSELGVIKAAGILYMGILYLWIWNMWRLWRLKVGWRCGSLEVWQVEGVLGLGTSGKL